MLNYSSKMRKLILKHKIESQQIGGKWGQTIASIAECLRKWEPSHTARKKKMSMGKTIWEGNLPLRDALMLWPNSSPPRLIEIILDT